MDWLTRMRAALPELAARSIKERALAKGQLLFVRGDIPKAMYCVISGEIRLVRTLSDGKEVVLQRARQGIVAEASLDRAAYHCDAIAIVPSRVLAIPGVVFKAGLEQPAFRDFWLGYVVAELRRARSQSERLVLKTGRERVLHFIETEGQHGRVVLIQSKKSWASELGLAHESLYRTLRKMVEDGEIAISGQSLELCRQAGD